MIQYLIKFIDRKKRQKERYQEFVVNLANFILKDWQNIALYNINNYPNLNGFRLSYHNKFTKSFLLFIPFFKLHIVDIDHDVFNDIHIDILNYDVYSIKKDNEEAYKLLNDIINELNIYNKSHGFDFIKVKHSIYNSNSKNGIILEIPVSKLCFYLK